MNQFIKYVGLDTHKDTIAVAIADTAGGKPRYYGEIANTPTALTKNDEGDKPERRSRFLLL
jgi:transposase